MRFRLGVRTEDHSASFGKVSNHVAHLDDLDRVETADRLVQDDQLRIVNDGQRDSDPLVAIGQRIDDSARVLRGLRSG